MEARKTRVLHSLFRVGSGGVEQTRLTLARGLDMDRYEQRLVCMDAFGALPGRLRDAGCQVDTVGDSFSVWAVNTYRQVLQIIREWRPHIVHGAVFEGVAMAAVAGRLGRVPVVIAEETSDPVNRSRAASTLYRGYCGLADHVIAVSPAVRNYLTERIHVPSRKVSMVYNGVVEPGVVRLEELAAIRERFALTASSFVIGTVGRLEDSHKRVSDLIRAMTLLRAEVADPRLLVVGDGEDANALAALARELGVGDRVHFSGYQPDVAPYYQIMDVFALASAHEAFGLVLAEAMLAERAVVATRVGGIPAVVDDGVSGTLVAPGDPAALAAALLALQRDPVRRERMGQQGRVRARSLFGAETYVAAVDALYDRCLSVARL